MKEQQHTQEELEEMLANTKKKNAKKQERERKAYVTKRDSATSELIQSAIALQEQLRQFKAQCHATMDEQREELEKYGKIRSNSKGGFSLVDSDGLLKVKRRRDTEPRWDERAEKGVELLKDFLATTVKKRDEKQYIILMGFLEKNAKGDLEYARVMSLLSHEELFDDTRWTEGLRLLKEGHHNYLKAYGYEFKTKVVTEDNPDGKWQNILLNFASL